MKLIFSFLIVALMAGLTGCSTTATHESKFTADTVTQIKTGMTKNEVVGLIGEPRSRSVNNDGGEIWQYRKNGQEGKAMKTFANITSFGLTSGVDAEYQDILSVMFKDAVVSKVTYQENVHNLGALENH